MITLPKARDWGFAVKTFAAALLALYLALWIDLPRPYWALTTVYITTQSFAETTRLKAIYRVCGTVLGAAVSIIIVPIFVNAPVLLSLVVALWASGCLYFSLLDRTPRAYLLMLAGYTVAIVAMPAVDEPNTIFDLAVARTEEITIGILCAHLVSSLVFPQSVRETVVARIGFLLRDMHASTADLFKAGHSSSRAMEQIRVAADAISLDAFAAPWRSSASGRGRASDLVGTLRQHMLIVVPIVASIADRVEALKRAHALPSEVEALLQRMFRWLDAQQSDAGETQRLRASIESYHPASASAPDANSLLLESLIARLLNLVDLQQDIWLLQHHIETGMPLRTKLAFDYDPKVHAIRHSDYLISALSVFGLFITILLICAIWIMTAWPDGSTAVMMAAIAYSFFANLDDPAPQIMRFAHSALTGAVGAAVYLFVFFPRATNFEMLALALAPGCMLCGLAMSRPKWATFGTGAALFGGTLLALQDSFANEFPAFINAAVSVLVGMWLAALVTRVMRSVEQAWTAQRLRGLNHKTLIEVATTPKLGGSWELAALMMDRVGLIASRLAALPPQDIGWTAELINEVRIGINLIELQRAVADRRVPRTRAAIKVILNEVAGFLRSGSKPASELRDAIDSALDLSLSGREKTDKTTSLALLGLRRAIFPDALAYEPDPVSSSQSSRAAA